MRRNPRLLLVAVIVVIGLISYYAKRVENPITGEKQSVALTPEQEIVLGLDSAPRMAQELGGLDPDPGVRQRVLDLGQRLVADSVASQSPYKFSFSVLQDRKTINAFALPGGPIFITRGLLDRLEDDGQVAGVLGHEIGHVLARHSAEQMAKSELAQTLVGAVGVAASDEQGRSRNAEMTAVFVAQMMQMKYGRGDELEADQLGVRLLSEAGYDPRVLIGVMKILESASSGGRQPEFMSTHPDPGNRKRAIQEAIQRQVPGGVPSGLKGGAAYPPPD
jgi:predicted Zn-dependent protease